MKRVLLLGLLLLPGCNALLTEGTADLAGLAGAGISKAVTDNGAVAAGIGLGVQTVARAGLQYTQRRMQRAEQDSIAAAAGPLRMGAVASWSVSHAIPIADNHQGEVTVSREIGALGLACREIVFSVQRQPPPAEVQASAVPPVAPRPPAGPGMAAAPPPEKDFYTAIICRQGERWKWASAEPATERWGSLQ